MLESKSNNEQKFRVGHVDKNIYPADLSKAIDAQKKFTFFPQNN